MGFRGAVNRIGRIDLMRLTLPQGAGRFEVIARRSRLCKAWRLRKLLFDTCANSRCAERFDYRKGRLFRFSYRAKNAEPGASHAVVHFWLCANCGKVYTLEYRERSGSAVLRRKHLPPKAGKPRAQEDSLQAAAAGSK